LATSKKFNSYLVFKEVGFFIKPEQNLLFVKLIINQSMIIFDCERMKYPNNGIYYYCLKLGLHLKKMLDEKVFFYVPDNQKFNFNTKSVIRQSPLHKFIMPAITQHKLWHSTFQFSDYIPILNNKIKIVITIHDLNFIYRTDISEEKKGKYIVNLQKRIDRADAIVCISNFAKNDLIKYCKLPREKIVTIYNGVNNLENPKLNSGSFFPLRPFLFSIGTIKGQKNFHTILPLIKDNPELMFIVAGVLEDSAYLKKMESMFIDLGLTNHFKYVGQITEQEKSWYYHNCYAFLFTSLSEGFGLPVVEAMSVGKPVFLSQNTALPEIGGSEAYYFDNYSNESMNLTFKNGMNHFNKNIELNSNKNIIRANQFSWEKAANEYINLYNQLI
jgi:glycosyltransferase involved in cell wall biosynthesis